MKHGQALIIGESNGRVVDVPHDTNTTEALGWALTHAAELTPTQIAAIGSVAGIKPPEAQPRTNPNFLNQ